MKIVCVGLALSLLLGAPALAQEPKFTAKPAATKTGDKVRIDFAVDRATDVAIFIEDGKGNILRHLVAGVLGSNPPAPLKASSLSQSVEWDGHDDSGKPVTGSATVRVALGTRLEPAGTAFSENKGPNCLFDVIGLVTGPDGRAYVLDARPGACEAPGTTLVQVFLRNGAFEKTIKPFLSHVPPERLKATRAFRDTEGRLVPVLHRSNGPEFYPYAEVPHQPAITPDGLLLLAVKEKDFKGGGAYLALLDGEGGVPTETYAGPALGEKGFRFDKTAALAAGGDGKSAFLVGIGPSASPLPKDTHAVYRVPLPERGPMAVFFGDPKISGTDQKHLNDPQGVALDGQGHLLVADFGNHRIVVLNEKDGSYVSSFAAEAPSWVGVDRRKGAVYVCSGEKTIVKFSGWKEAKEISRLDLPKPGRSTWRLRWSFALDTSEDPPVLWMGRNETTWDKGTPLYRCEDLGATFGKPEKPGYYRGISVRDLRADPLRRQVSYNDDLGLCILDEQTGQMHKYRARPTGQGFTVVPGLPGTFYGMAAGVGVSQHDGTGKQVPFPASRQPNGTLDETIGAGTKPARPSICVDRNGDIYAWSRGKGINVYGPDGAFQRTVLSQVLERHVVGPRVDTQGNIYIADAVGPVGVPYPENFQGRLGDGKSPADTYCSLYGSIIKFGPRGGMVWCPWLGKGGWEKVEDRSFEKVRIDDASLKVEDVVARGKPDGKLQGALWWRHGFSPILAWPATPGCHCLSNEFDVDDFGRVFYPDVAKFRVVMLDPNGNEMLSLGAYGNQNYCGSESYVMDPKGKFLRPRQATDPKDLKSPFAEPEIAFAWIGSLAVTDRYLYVSDVVNMRVLRFKLSYTAAAEIRVVP